MRYMKLAMTVLCELACRHLQAAAYFKSSKYLVITGMRMLIYHTSYS